MLDIGRLQLCSVRPGWVGATLPARVLKGTRYWPAKIALQNRSVLSPQGTALCLPGPITFDLAIVQAVVLFADVATGAHRGARGAARGCERWIVGLCNGQRPHPDVGSKACSRHFVL